MQPEFEPRHQSEVIRLCRFPLAVCVVYIHCYYRIEDSEAAYIFHYVMQHYVCNCAVPLFMMISGYLFFCKESVFNWGRYKSKLSKRLRSLVLPYLLWNLVTFLFLYIRNSVSFTLQDEVFDNLSVSSFASFFWNSKTNVFDSGFPIDGPLWFIRDLMICAVLSPVIYKLISHYPRTVLAVTLFIASINLDFVFRFDALLYFEIGSIAGIYRKTLIELFWRYRYLNSILWILLVFVTLCLDTNLWIMPLFRILLACISAIQALFIFSIMNKKYSLHVLKEAGDASLFVYASHKIAIVILFFVLSLLGKITEITTVMIIILNIVSPILISYACYYLRGELKRIAPILVKTLDGGR